MNTRKRTRFTLIWSLLILSILSLSTQSPAQSQNPSSGSSNTKEAEQVIICPEYVAIVKVDVTDRHGKEVADLTKDDFIIYEDGVKQELVYWKRNAGSDRQPDQPRYEAGYYPTNYRFREEWRKIRVLVRDQDNRRLKVQFTPKGYYAKKELRK